MCIFQPITLHKATNSPKSRNKIRLAFHFIELKYLTVQKGLNNNKTKQFVSFIQTVSNLNEIREMYALWTYFLFILKPRYNISGKPDAKLYIANSPGGGGVLGSIFAGYVPPASQNPYPIIVYFVTKL